MSDQGARGPTIVGSQFGLRRLCKIDPKWEKIGAGAPGHPAIEDRAPEQRLLVRQAASEVLAKLDKSHIPAPQSVGTDTTALRRSPTGRNRCVGEGPQRL